MKVVIYSNLLSIHSVYYVLDIPNANWHSRNNENPKYFIRK